jgi:hypothetical protein
LTGWSQKAKDRELAVFLLTRRHFHINPKDSITLKVQTKDSQKRSNPLLALQKKGRISGAGANRMLGEEGIA